MLACGVWQTIHCATKMDISSRFPRWYLTRVVVVVQTEQVRRPLIR